MYRIPHLNKREKVKQEFQITNHETINQILDSTEYGTLALCADNQPYAVPVNFVRIADDIYFHGALNNKKMKMLRTNPAVSFSVTQAHSIIASFMSSTDGLACPATQFFQSISIDGIATIIDDREQKAEIFEAMMQKLQPEGGYEPFDSGLYDKALKATAVIKISPSSTEGKYKFGQHLTQERYQMILEHLAERNTPADKLTIELMQTSRSIK